MKNDIIRRLTASEYVRTRPEIFFEWNGKKGCLKAFEMLLSCSLEEAALGYGKEIIITMYKDNSITIEDNGRGIYVYDETNTDLCWKERFCEFYPETKSDTANSKKHAIGWMCSNTEERVNSFIPYEIHSSSLKLCAPQYASEFMNVRICRDSRLYTLHFEKGENIGGLKSIKNHEGSGTLFHFKFDKNVFKDIQIPVNSIRTMLRKCAIHCRGVKFTLILEDNEEMRQQIFYYKNGIQDHIKELATGQKVSSIGHWEIEGNGKERFDLQQYYASIRIAFCFSNKHPIIECYHNNRYLEYGGNHLEAILESIKLCIQEKTHNVFRTREIEEHIILVVETLSEDTRYENGARKSIQNKVIRDMAKHIICKNLPDYLNKNQDFIQNLSSVILKERELKIKSNDIENIFECAKKII